MCRAVSVALGCGLIILWIAGVSSHAEPWLTWLDAFAGLIAIGLGVGFAKATRAGVAGWGLLAFALFVLWIIGLAAGGTLWLAWWTSGFAFAFLILAASATSGQSRLRHRTA